MPENAVKQFFRFFHAVAHHVLVQYAVLAQILVRVLAALEQLAKFQFGAKKILGLLGVFIDAAKPLGVICVGHAGFFVQVINGDAVKCRDSRKQRHIRQGGVAFPAGDALGADPKGLGGLLLDHTTIQIVARDRNNLLVDVSTAFSATKTRITSLNARPVTVDGFGVLDVGIEVEDGQQLKTVMNRLEQIPGVMKVTRPTG